MKHKEIYYKDNTLVYICGRGVKREIPNPDNYDKVDVFEALDRATASRKKPRDIFINPEGLPYTATELVNRWQKAEGGQRRTRVHYDPSKKKEKVDRRAAKRNGHSFLGLATTPS